jgi:hypothetical protein
VYEAFGPAARSSNCCRSCCVPTHCNKLSHWLDAKGTARLSIGIVSCAKPFLACCLFDCTHCADCAQCQFHSLVCLVRRFGAPAAASMAASSCTARRCSACIPCWPYRTPCRPVCTVYSNPPTMQNHATGLSAGLLGAPFQPHCVLWDCGALRSGVRLLVEEVCKTLQKQGLALPSVCTVVPQSACHHNHSNKRRQ